MAEKMRGSVVALGMIASGLAISPAWAQDSQVGLHHQLCVQTRAQPAAVAPLVSGDEWRSMFSGGDADLVSRVSVDDPMDVVMARVVVSGDIREAVCSVQRSDADYPRLKAEFEAATGLTPVGRYSSRTVAVYIARAEGDRLISEERPEINRARRDPDARIFSLSRMGDDALIVVSFPQR